MCVCVDMTAVLLHHSCPWTQSVIHTQLALQGTVQMDVDQQDYLGVLLGDPDGFGSSAGSQALKAAPANKGTRLQ